jgi:hypothetical protein
VRWRRGASPTIIACVAKQIEVRNVKTFPENGSGSPAATTLQAGKMREWSTGIIQAYCTLWSSNYSTSWALLQGIAYACGEM